MLYIIIIAAVLFVLFFIYQGALSPFANLQRLLSRLGKYKAIIYLQLNGWDTSYFPIKTAKNNVWEVVFMDSPDVVYITYEGDLKESEAMKILCKKIKREENKSRK